jgi:uncharacterized protein (DUF1697 family)
MPAYIAMLRGVNVSGHKPLPMERLRTSLAPLGFTSVKTYLQSGNVVFETAKASPSALAAKIQGVINRDFGFSVPVIIRTAADMTQIVTDNPFMKDPRIDPLKVHVTFLSDLAPKTAPALLLPLADGPERLHVSGREIYLYCPNGYGRTRLSNTAIEKKLALAATTRNWKTVNALMQMGSTGV